jgi:uncharacterized repeat protein (TIGR04042 family)
MPEMHFSIQWPNGDEDECYSPSYIIEEYLAPGSDYAVADFMQRATAALEIASERVRVRYGFACSSALDQVRELEEKHARLTAAEQAGKVKVLSFQKHAPRDARAPKPSSG